MKFKYVEAAIFAMPVGFAVRAGMEGSAAWAAGFATFAACCLYLKLCK